MSSQRVDGVFPKLPLLTVAAGPSSRHSCGRKLLHMCWKLPVKVVLPLSFSRFLPRTMPFDCNCCSGAAHQVCCVSQTCCRLSPIFYFLTTTTSQPCFFVYFFLQHKNNQVTAAPIAPTPAPAAAAVTPGPVVAATAAPAAVSTQSGLTATANNGRATVLP